MVSLSNRHQWPFSDPWITTVIRRIVMEEGVTKEIIDSDVNDLSNEILEVTMQNYRFG